MIPPRHRRLRGLALVVAVGLAVRLVAAIAATDFLMLDERIYVDAARAMAEGRAGLDPLCAPLYPGFLAALFRCFGPGLLAPRLAHALLGALTVVLTYALGSRIHPGRGALVAASFVAVLPELAGFTALFYTEHLFLPLVIGAVVALVAAIDRPDRLARFVLAGTLVGLAALTREVALALGAVAAGFVLVAPGPGRLRRCAAFLLPACLLVVAWMSVNAARFGTFTFTANRWKPILEGNCSSEDLAQYHEVLYRDRFEAEAFAKARALSCIAAAQPTWVLRKTAAAFRGLVDPRNFIYRQIRRAGGERGASAVLFLVGTPLLALLLLGGALGFLAAPPDRRTTLLLALMACLFAIHVLSFAVSRHRLPFLPMLAVGAGYFFSRLARGGDGLRSLARPSRLVGAAAAAISIALVWFEFFAERT